MLKWQRSDQCLKGLARMGKIALENYRVFNLKIDNSATTQPVKTYRTFPGYSQYRNFDFFFVSISCIYWPAYRLWKDFSWEVKSWYFKFQCLPKCSHFILIKSLLSVFFLFDQLKKYPENHCFFICLFIRLFFCLFYFILFLEMYC